ncbi:MAG: tripartite tricarboxylate transporter TctB family protein, partial [Pseudolabrys sp.]|nr:tripartite tricarboxylate transporter TctB family protein [Pseudolabrys sp.]
MLSTIKRHQDRFAGGVILAFGLAAALIASTYEVGSLARMGPGL